MIYIKNNTEIQTIFIPRTELQSEAYNTTVKTYEDGYKDGFGEGKQHQKDQLLNLYVTENGEYKREDGWGVVTVDMSVPDCSGAYNEGYNQGYEDGQNSVECPEGGDCNIIEFQDYTLKDEAEKIYASDYGADGFAIVSIDAIDLCKQKYNEGFEYGKSQGGGETTTYPTIADIYNSEVNTEVTFKATVAGIYQNGSTYYLIVTDHTGAYSINFRNECPLSVGDECVFTGINKRNTATLIRYMQIPTNYEVLSSNNYVVLPAEALNIKDANEIYSPNEYGNAEIKYMCFEGEVISINQTNGSMKLILPILGNDITLRSTKQEWRDNIKVGDTVKVYAFAQESNNYFFPFEMVKLGSGSCNLGEEWIILGQESAGAKYELIASENGYDGYSKVTIEVENFTADCPMSEIWTADHLSNRIVNDNISGGEEYVRGTITSIQEVSTQYGNATYIIDDVFKVYRGKWFYGEPFYDENQIQVGDWVIVKGTTQNYNGQAQFKAGSQVVEHKRCEGGSGNCDDAFNQGYMSGVNDGYNQGYNDGQATCEPCNLQHLEVTENGWYEPRAEEFGSLEMRENSAFDTGVRLLENSTIEILFNADENWNEIPTLIGCEDSDWNNSTFAARWYIDTLFVRIGDGDVQIPLTSEDFWSKLHKLKFGRFEGVWFDDEYVGSLDWADWVITQNTIYIGAMHNTTDGENGIWRPWNGYISNVTIYGEKNGESRDWHFEAGDFGKWGEYRCVETNEILPNLMGDGGATFETGKQYGEPPFRGYSSVSVNTPIVKDVNEYPYHNLTFYTYRGDLFENYKNNFDFTDCFYNTENQSIPNEDFIVTLTQGFPYKIEVRCKQPIKACYKMPIGSVLLYGFSKMWFNDIEIVNLTDYGEDDITSLVFTRIGNLTMNYLTFKKLANLYAEVDSFSISSCVLGTETNGNPILYPLNEKAKEMMNSLPSNWVMDESSKIIVLK